MRLLTPLGPGFHKIGQNPMANLLVALAFVMNLTACEQKQTLSKRVPSKKELVTEKDAEPRDRLAEISSIFTKEAFESRGLSIEKLSFEFTYIDEVKSGPIDFGDQDVVDVTIGDHLPVGTSGTMTLKVFDDDTVLFQGEKAGVVLSPGQNEVNLDLMAVELNSASLKIRLRIIHNDTLPDDEAEPTQPSPTDVPSGWDAVSFKGNAEYDIAEL